MHARHVVLINLPSPWLISDTDQPPMGLLCLAASLREHGSSVEICDLAGQNEAEWFVPEGDLYGIGFTTPQYDIARRLVAQLLTRDGYVVVGGAHPSALPMRTFQELRPDALFVGEADWSLADFVLGRNLASIPGLVWEDDDGKARYNGNPPIVPVDLLPMPARDLIDMDRYMDVKTYRWVGGTKEGYIAMGRGCPYNCAFCSQHNITQGVVRRRTIRQVVDEIKILKYRYGCDQLYVADDTFNLDHDWVEELCNAIKPLNMVWQCLLRADYVNKRLAKALYSAGCRAAAFGMESGSDKILRAMHKGFTVAQVLEAMEIVRTAGIRVRAQMIVGFPGEDEETISQTENVVRATPVDRWGFHIYAPLPGSPAWEHPERYGLQIDRAGVDFGHGFTTVGRPGEWDETLIRAKGWLDRLIEAAGQKNVFLEAKA